MLMQALVLKSLEDYDENANNEMLEEVAANSPVVGEKRQREEDEHDEQQPKHAPPSEIKTEPDSRAPSTVTARSLSVNGGHSTGNGTASMGAPMNNPMGGGQGSDALYIGDLQWVSVFA